MKGKPVIPPIYMTATYKFDESDDLIDVVQNQSGYIYSRWDNPSVVAVEKTLAALEGYERALGFGSGMAAITTALMAHVRAGDRIVSTREIYGGTFEMMNSILPRFGVDVTLVNCSDTDRLLAEIDKGLTLLYLESPTNPVLRVVDVPLLAAAARTKGAVVLLDGTFASPVNQHPADWGVDVLIHSGTKYLGGHHDVTAGMVCCNQPFADRIGGCAADIGVDLVENQRRHTGRFGCGDLQCQHDARQLAARRHLAKRTLRRARIRRD